MNNSFLIHTDNIKDLITNNSIIIDIRDEYEYKKQHIKTSINIPYEVFHLYKRRFRKEIPLYIICNYGNKSKILVNELRQEGYIAYSFINGYYGLHHNYDNNYY